MYDESMLELPSPLWRGIKGGSRSALWPFGHLSCLVRHHPTPTPALLTAGRGNEAGMSKRIMFQNAVWPGL
jgi:hypothetical protein